jgi:indole-3-glycerol phosphate synthase
MNILEKIVARKREEVRLAKQAVSVQQLEASPYFQRDTASLTERLLLENSTGIIAEFKRQSPSKGILNHEVNPVDVVSGYERAGVAGSSVLTDTDFFGGSRQDFLDVRANVSIPLLRKDFMIDEYQFLEAKSWGADVVLLIASILTPAQVSHFTALAKSLMMEVLLELHDETELDHVNDMVDMVGINNRNLKTFSVDTEQSVRMAEQLGNDVIKVAESGITSVETLRYFKQHGFHGFLIGENFMKNSNPAQTCAEFISTLSCR